MTQLYIAFRRTISTSKISIDKGKGWKMILQGNGIQRKAGVAIFISDKMDFKIKKASKDKGRYFIMIKWILYQEKNVCTQSGNTEIYKSDTNGTIGRK